MTEEVRAAQKAVFQAVDAQVAEWSIEHDEHGWRADAFLPSRRSSRTPAAIGAMRVLSRFVGCPRFAIGTGMSANPMRGNRKAREVPARKSRYKKKRKNYVFAQKRNLKINKLSGRYGGGAGIRTLGRSPFTGFQDQRFRPLSHPSGCWRWAGLLRDDRATAVRRVDWAANR